MPIQFLCPTCHKRYCACRTVCRRDGTVRSLPAAHVGAGRAASDCRHKRARTSTRGVLSGPPLLPSATKSRGVPKAVWIGIVATALIGVIIAIVVVLSNKKESNAEKQIAANTEPGQPTATPPDSLPQQALNKSPGSRSTNDSTAPPVRATPAEPVTPATPRAPSNSTNDRENTAARSTTPPKQAAVSAAPANRWLKPFVPKNDEASTDAARKPKPSVSATPNVWNVKPDPAPQQITSGETKWADVEVPVVDRGHGMVHPLRPSPFVAIYGEDRGKRHVGTIDLRDGKKKGPFAIESRGRELPKLSFNGKWLAWLQNGDAAIQIHSLDDGKPGRRITPGGTADFRWHDFTDGAHLVTYTTEFGNKAPRLELWSVASGESVRNFELPIDAEGQNPEAATVSPGGAYVALGMKSALYIYEVASGNLIGEVRLPPLSEHDQEGKHATFQALAFSWDGRELAAMLYSFGNSHFVVWATDTGKVAANVQASQRLPAFGRNSGPRLEWLQSDGLLVDGKLLFHREALRQPVEEFKGRTEFRRMLSWNKAVTIDSGKRARGMALVSMKLPGDELLKRAATLKAGGELVETGLPALKVADFSRLKQVDLSVKPDGWDVTAEPVSAVDELKLQLDLSLARGDQFKKAHLANAHVTVLREATDGGLKRFLDRYDRRRGNRDATVEIYPESNLIDVSANGELALVRSGSQSPRLDIIDLDERKHVVGWKPYSDFPGEKGSGWNLDRAMFVDHEHVITLRKMNELIVWKVPECKALLIVTDAWNVQLSDDGRYFVTRAPNESAWAIHDTLTGKPCGRIAFGSVSDLIEDISFDPPGKHLAILRHHASYSRVALVDLATGQPAGELALPPPAQAAKQRPLGRTESLVDRRPFAGRCGSRRLHLELRARWRTNRWSCRRNVDRFRPKA